jgi:hypothetical protein
MELEVLGTVRERPSDPRLEAWLIDGNPILIDQHVPRPRR